MGDSEGGGTSSSSQIEPDEEGSTQNNTTVNIRVKTLSDQECIIPIGLHETVSVLRERIHEHLGIEPSEQRIIFQGRVLVTDRTLQSYSLQDGYTVHMIDRPPESSESFLNTRTGERAANGEHSIRRPRARVHLQQNDPTAADSLLMRQSIGQIMPRLNNLTIEQADGADETINRQAGRFTWRLFLEDNEFSLNRERIELYVRNSIENLPFLTAEDRNRFTLNWVNNELRIDLPRIDPHVASPAFERLAFVELNANYLRVFNDICQEPDGLVTIVRRILDRLQDPENVERMTAIERHEFGQRLEDIIVRLESINSVLPSNRSIDDTRIRNSTEVQRQSRYERIPADRSNPSFVMRHAIDCDLAQVLREFRRQQSRFFEIESLLDETIETSAIPRIRAQVNSSMDNNYIAISAFYTHIQRMRHHISHTLHISSEIEVAFTSNNTHGGPQRLLPNYELSRFNVPRAHIGTLIVAFRRPQRTEQVHERVSNVFSPPKIRADVGRMEPGQWPYLTFYPTGMLQEQHEMAFPVMTMEMTMEQVDEPMDETTANQQPSTSNEPTTIEVRAGRPHEIMNVLSQIMSNPQIRPPSSSSSSGDSQSTSHTTTSTQPEPTVIPPPQSRRGIRERIGNIIPYFRQQSQREQDIPRSSDSTAATAGSATPSSTDSNPSSSPVQPSLPREMRGDAATLLRESQLISRLLAEPRRQQDMRTSRGPETESLAPFPQTVSPTELHNIAQNIASRYRDDAITRIATNLTAAFQEQAPAWDTRLTSIPLRTQRFMLALVLELLTMSARNLEESREMMLALVRDESILIRAIIESMKSLFLLGEFPTHVGRIILQQHSTVGQRVDYESRDGSDSDDTDDMVVRMPSDVSQPRSGSLRDIANARARRRQIVESRRNTSVDPARQAFSASALPVGPSLRAFDQAQVEAGFLPTGPIRQPSASSSSSTDRASVRVAQLRAMLEDTDEMFRDDFARMQEQLAQTQQRIASRLFSAQSNNSDQNPSTSGTNNIGAMTRVHRQTVSIDPFLSCHNRHSDFNRAHNLGSTGSEGDRMTNQSNEPNPNYNHYVSRLDIPQRDTDSVVDDEDFTYEITRNASGELQIQNTEDGRLQFQRIMQTAFRSLFGQLVESDAIMALNSVNLNGFPAPRNEVVQEMLERHPFMVAAAAQSASDNLIAPEILQRPRSAGGNVQNSENDASRRLPRQFFDPTAAISSSLPNISNLSDVVFQAGGLAPRNMRAPAEFDISYPIPTATEVASDALSGLHTFLQSHVGSFPRGLFGLLCELLRNRIGRNDLGGLINQEIATRVIGSMQNVFRQHLIDNQMNGNTRPSRDDIQSVAERLAAEESFFNCYNLSSTNGNGLPINIRGRIYSFGWTFRQLEIDTIRRLLELVLKKTEKDEFVKSVIDIIRQHLQRMLSVFYWFYEGNYENMRQSIIHSFPVWIRTLRSTRDDPETVQMVAASNRIVQTWFDLFSEESTNEVAQFFERLQNQSTLSNLRTSCSNKSNSNSPSSSPSTRERCGDVEEAGESSAKRRKCDEEMEVDVGEEVMEDYDGTEDDNNKPTNSNDSTKK